MAVKNHALDERITDAAMAVFLEYGYQKATLHTIADKAGVTTGALYTRYENKDALFCSLVQAAFEKIAADAKLLYNNYRKAENQGSAETILTAIQQEEEAYLELLFEYYDECVLFICCSDGSSVEQMIQQRMEQKAAQTVAFLERISKKKIHVAGVQAILCSQFRCYREILQRKYSRDEALACLRFVENFLNAGWKSLLEEVL